MSAGSETRWGRAAAGRPPHPLELVAVDKRFGRRHALRGVDLRVRAGEVVVLTGPNGSGKTTLLHVAAGLRRADRGSVLVLGAPAGSRVARGAVALVPDEPTGFDELTVAELVALGAALAREAPAPGAAAIARLELDDLRDSRVGSLSRGQRRRVALAAALAGDPVVLLVDEATATLDAGSVDALVGILRRHAATGGAAVVATHDASFVPRAGDRVVLLSGGSVVGSAPAAAFATLEALREAADSGPASPCSEVDAGVAAAAR